MGDEKNTSKKNIAGKIFFISRNELGFYFISLFYIESDCFFSEIDNNLMRAGQ